MLEKLNALTEGHGALGKGRGLITGVIALSLGFLCFLGVLAFHFPQYLTTPGKHKKPSDRAITPVISPRPLPNAPWLSVSAFSFSSMLGVLLICSRSVALQLAQSGRVAWTLDVQP